MDRSTPQVRNPSNTVVDMLGAIYCFFLSIKIGYWLVGDGWDLARVGDVPVIMLPPAALTCILLAVSGLLLCRRSAKSTWFLFGSLLFGLSLIPLMLSDIFLVLPNLIFKVALFVLPAALQAALLVGIWAYSLQMRRSGYFK